MNNRIKKLSSWSMPIAVISAVLYLTVSFINGDRIGSPQTYARQLKPVKPFLASLSNSISASVILLWEKINNATSPSQTGEGTAPADSADSYVFTPTSTSQTNETFSPVTPAPNSYVSAPTSTNGGSSTGGFASSARFPDLAVQIVDTGILSGNDVFTHATSTQAGQRAAVVFDVKNIGGSVSPEWNFRAAIPTPDSNYTSLTQSALAPGEGIRFTMAFSNLGSNGTNTVSFVVDPNTKVTDDPDRNNNTTSTTLFRNY